MKLCLYIAVTMDIEFKGRRLERLAYDPKESGGLPPQIVSKYREVLNYFGFIQNRQSIRNWKGLRLEKLKGDRKGKWSVKLNEQWRLIVEFGGEDRNETVIVVSIEDYH